VHRPNFLLPWGLEKGGMGAVRRRRSAFVRHRNCSTYLPW